MRKSRAGEQRDGEAVTVKRGRHPDRVPASLASEPRWRVDVWCDEAGNVHQWNVTSWSKEGELVVMRANPVSPFDPHDGETIYAAAQAYVRTFGVQLALF